MSYIYKITNIINEHAYVGKTDRSIEERWKEHLKDVNRKEFAKRPLYRAIKKYGKENFIIEKLEECSPELAAEREHYWIEILGTFKNGYNATKGGEGKSYLDYDLIYKTYLICKSGVKTATLLGIDPWHVNKVINSYGERPYSPTECLAKPVARLDKYTEEILEIFASISEANKKYNCGRHINDVCKGKRKTAGGYKWKYI